MVLFFLTFPYDENSMENLFSQSFMIFLTEEINLLQLDTSYKPESNESN